MPSWNEVANRMQSAGDAVRVQYVKELAEYTGRNVFTYYSAWMYRNPSTPNLNIGDDDLNAFMQAVHSVDRSKGLDLVLHTPGGSVAAAEQIVTYLRDMFDGDVRAIVPQGAYSAGTLICCAAHEILMGKESSLGPIDPLLNGKPAQSVVDEFDRAIKDVEENPHSLPIWQTIIGKYHPSFLEECRHALELSRTMASTWLRTGVFRKMGDETAAQRAEAAATALADHVRWKTHGRHLSVKVIQEDVGIPVTLLEEDEELQDRVLSLHHAYTCSITNNPAILKIVENQEGSRMVTAAKG